MDTSNNSTISQINSDTWNGESANVIPLQSNALSPEDVQHAMRSEVITSDNKSGLITQKRAIQSMTDFFQMVLPPEGPYALKAFENERDAIKDGRKMKPLGTKFFNTQEALLKEVKNRNKRGETVFFGTASFKNDEGKADGDNVKALSAYRVDLDIGSATSKYSSQIQALNDLKRVSLKIGLPIPLVINSGGGVHAYWPLSEPVEATEWVRVAKQLKSKFEKEGLKQDKNVTADIARVMRCPGTTHRKTDIDKSVEIIPFKFNITTPENFADILTRYELTDGFPAGGIEFPVPSNINLELPETPENIQRVKSLLKAVSADCSYVTYRQIVWSVMSTGWECAEEIALNWSMTAPYRFEQQTFDNIVSSYDTNAGTTLGTLYHHAREAGWEDESNEANESNESGESNIEEFNHRHFVAKVGGSVFVFDENDDNVLAGGMSFTSFQQFKANLPNGANAAKNWLSSDGRRTYDGIIFDPTGKFYENRYNTYTGLAIKPKAGNCNRILKHIEAVWCSGSTDQFSYLIKWLAKLVQKPWIKPEVALVLRSPEGVGKTLIIEDILLAIFGCHAFVAAQKDQVAGRFNAHLFDKILIILEEAFFAGDHAAVASTKALVTNKQIGYEAKGKDAFSAPNYAHVISLTNEDWAAPAGADSRRWMVFDVSDQKKGDFKYFKELYDEIENGGREAFLNHLMHIDISDFNPRKLPTSNALHDQQVQTIMRTDPVKGWWLNVLSEGSFTVKDGAIEWSEEIASEDIQESYNYSTMRTRTSPAWDEAAKQLRKLVPMGALKKKRKSDHGLRWFNYQLPDLETARKYFESVTGVDPCKL